ncbi:hypothetical protein RIF29_39644 [Crotalaria pallida]|uniref:RRM domain-containing protein n=1 Tax=Crotalaria pallida TaxID=3830 RepID=A0AAN9HQX0_CROPI
MDSDKGKLFIGGISWDTNEDKLGDYFGNYGNVSHAFVMRDKNTSKPRGFAFVIFSDPSLLDRVLQNTHVIDGRTPESKLEEKGFLFNQLKTHRCDHHHRYIILPDLK